MHSMSISKFIESAFSISVIKFLQLNQYYNGYSQTSKIENKIFENNFVYSLDFICLQ